MRARLVLTLRRFRLSPITLQRRGIVAAPSITNNNSPEVTTSSPWETEIDRIRNEIWAGTNTSQ